MHPQTTANLRSRLFYHGTSRDEAASIVAGGFRVLDRLMWRALGQGVYMTANAGTALFFGPVVLQVELRRGARLLDVSAPWDRRVVAFLEREFGREILAKPPRMVLPANKRLTLEETVALFRYHYGNKNFWSARDYWKRVGINNSLLREMRSLLLRHGFHGFGNADDLNGIVLFAEDCIRAADVVIDLPEAEYCSEAYLRFESSVGDDDEGSPHRSLSAVEARLAELFPCKSSGYRQAEGLALATTTALER